ncbi:hypothetical protein [Hymenobacter sp. BRD67]|uniref:hypothetical protein n=1 Tax=Hymenobacter sp. BRD67 TaxID=2675877 RepID=UPI001566D6E8|nr:hypothetical protein [Hymenobacter sp. BRD67]QKG52514.1 hypothetical protein GKZ67_07775 [Hymenobacter sp. BRD67]
MPKLIDYPRTSYSGAWEVAEVVDDTGGKCALDTCARKLNRKVSGSFKAIVGSAVKFGLLTSKRELLATTTLFRRIKHAYDKQEELVFHREAFLTPPLFTQLCRKFRSRELPVAMLDVLLMREFGVEEINAQGVSKAFVDGARMVKLLDEHNIIADIDQLAAQLPPRRELASPTPAPNVFRQLPLPSEPETEESDPDPTDDFDDEPLEASRPAATLLPQQPAFVAGSKPLLPPQRPAPAATTDAIASLFGLNGSGSNAAGTALNGPALTKASPAAPEKPITPPTSAQGTGTAPAERLFRIQLTGPA